MKNRLCIITCSNFKGELENILKTLEPNNVDIKYFHSLCGRRETDIKTLELTNYGKVYILGSCCLTKLNCPREELKNYRLFKVENCFDLLLSKSLVNFYKVNGNYILSSAWLNNWKHHIEEMGFNKEIAREFYNESIKKLILFDTLIYPETHEQIKEFSDFVDIPYDIIPVGTDFFKQIIEKIIFEFRLENEKSLTKETLLQIADLNMILDLIGIMALASNEDKVIEKILELFNKLFAPKDLVYIPIKEGNAEKPRVHPVSSNISEITLNNMLNLEGNYKFDDNDNGFIFKINNKNETFGIIKVGDLEFPKYKDKYLNLSLNLVKVFTLAISNARLFDKINLAQEKLKNTLVELEKSNKDLEQFAYIASHDLKEPLTIIVGFLELLEDQFKEKLGTEGAKYIKIAVDRTKDMLELINDLLVYARLDQHDKTFTLIDCEYILQKALSNLEKSISDSGAVVTHDPLPKIEGIETQFVQLFQNLIGNAVKFRGKESPLIQLKASQNGEEWVFSVKDNGIGINPREKDNIFIMFKRLHGTGKYSGSGIGLATCKKIVEHHNGRIWVESEPGEGSEFFFTVKT